MMGLSLASADVLLHACLGVMFTSTAACVVGACKHVKHRRRRRLSVAALTAVLLYAEAVVTVWAVG